MSEMARPAPRPTTGPPGRTFAWSSPSGPAIDEQHLSQPVEPFSPQPWSPLDQAADAIADATTDATTDAAADSPLTLLRELDRSVAATLAAGAPSGTAEWRVVETRLDRLDDLIVRVGRLPLVADPQALTDRLAELRRTDIRACLREIDRACRQLGAVEHAWHDDPESMTDLLDTVIEQLENRGEPEIRTLPGPAGGLDGSAPRRPIADLTIRDSRAVVYGCGTTVHVVHRCTVERPVIEVASLLDYDEAADTEAWFHSVEPVRATGTDGMQTRIIRSSGVSIGTGSRQHSVFTHRIPSCTADLGAVVALPPVRQAILDHRRSGGTPEATAALREAVRRAVDGVDVSVLVPDGMVARLAADRLRTPSLRGGGPTLTIRHGAGVAVGWDTSVTGETRIDVGRPTVR